MSRLPLLLVFVVFCSSTLYGYPQRLSSSFPFPTRMRTLQLRPKKWYNWNEVPEVSKKWYDWQEMPAAEKRSAQGINSDVHFDNLYSHERPDWVYFLP